MSRARAEQYNVDVTVLIVELSNLLGVAKQGEKDNYTASNETGDELHHIDRNTNSTGDRETQHNNQTTDTLLSQMTLIDVHRTVLEQAMNKLIVVMALACAPLSLVLDFVQCLPILTEQESGAVGAVGAVGGGTR